LTTGPALRLEIVEIAVLSSTETLVRYGYSRPLIVAHRSTSGLPVVPGITAVCSFAVFPITIAVLSIVAVTHYASKLSRCKELVGV
jgi:hypothetical protein